ncbi:MAG TPA: hypothetical protein VJ553_07160 [Candidatus Paceibacterota bacterium]|nr:hypothetical protein [Candidatus Paceibacterota bacterium]
MCKDKVQLIVEAVLPGLDDDLTAYLESCRRNGVPVSRFAAIQELEHLAFSPEKITERTQQARKYALPPGILERVWRDCFRRLRERAGH